LYARGKDIKVAYTPNGPTNSVAEYTINLMLTIMRQSYKSNIALRDGIWKKFIGNSIEGSNIGLFGAGRIGKEVIRLISIFKPNKIMVYDPFVKHSSLEDFDVIWSEKDQILSESNLISMHLPLSDETRDFIVMRDMRKMLPDSILINTSRGGIINEQDLYEALKKNIIGGAAIDVFDEEPYTGNLSELDNCFISAHMSPMSSAARKKMELDTAMEVINYAKNGMLYNEVPQYEYEKRITKG
jgi:D-3-phosphoglycerate dehydrogenase